MKVGLSNVKQSFKANASTLKKVITNCLICAAIGMVIGMCAGVTHARNEHRFGAEVSSYRLEWFTALASPGVALVTYIDVAYFESVDSQLGSTSASRILWIAISNGLSYLIASLVISLAWFAVVEGRRGQL